MLIKTMFRRRPRVEENVATLNTALLNKLVSIPGLWGSGKSVSDAIFDLGEGVSTVDLRQCLATGMFGQIMYAARSPRDFAEDHAQFDDWISIEINPEDADYR